MLSFLPPLQPRCQQGALDRTAVLASTHNSRTALLGAQVPRAQLPEALRILPSRYTDGTTEEAAVVMIMSLWRDAG